MDYFDIIKLLIMLIVLITIVYYYILSLINSIKYKVPQVSTFPSDFKILKKNLWKYNLKGKKIADLWSWIWKVIRFFEKEFGVEAIWFEIDSSNALIARVINKIFWSKTKIINWSYFEADLKQYDFIYFCLYNNSIIF